MDLKAHSRRWRMLADLGLEHGIGQVFRKQATLRQGESGRQVRSTVMMVK
ncbi:hypothetical protein [Bradyrhizobium liaoningense]|nr:hypothetical protein [Bradyrhizobium liaoningense]